MGRLGPLRGATNEIAHEWAARSPQVEQAGAPAGGWPPCVPWGGLRRPNRDGYLRFRKGNATARAARVGRVTWSSGKVCDAHPAVAVPRRGRQTRAQAERRRRAVRAGTPASAGRRGGPSRRKRHLPPERQHRPWGWWMWRLRLAPCPSQQQEGSFKGIKCNIPASKSFKPRDPGFLPNPCRSGCRALSCRPRFRLTLGRRLSGGGLGFSFPHLQEEG